MKLRLIALAAGLAAASATHALTPADIATARTAGTIKEITVAGASALRLSLAAYVAEICNTATMHVYFDSVAGTNHRAYSCNLAKAVGNYAVSTPIVVYKRDQGGSGQGVNPIATNTATAQMKIANDATCTVVAATPNYTDIQVANYICTTTESRVADVGISDVEPNLLNQAPNLADSTAGNPSSGAVSPVNLSNLVVTPFVQGIFAVAVNKQAYWALQQTQFPSQTAGRTIADIDTLPQPSLPTTFVRNYLTGGLSATATTKRGWGQVISESVDAGVNTKAFNVCRRQPGSGTQAASNAYFAQNPCGITPSSVLRQAAATAPTHSATGSFIVNEQAGTGGVETCLGTTVNGISGAYGLAVLGRENNPLANGGDKGYRYVKLDGMEPVRYNGSTGAATGHYDFVYESTIQYNSANPGLNADKIAFISGANGLATGPTKPAALAAADADTQQGVMSPPVAWASLGQYPALNGSDKPFASRVSRASPGDSCSVLKLTR